MLKHIWHYTLMGIILGRLRRTVNAERLDLSALTVRLSPKCGKKAETLDTVSLKAILEKTRGLFVVLTKG
jgi:hypothetical protein